MPKGLIRLAAGIRAWTLSERIICKRWAYHRFPGVAALLFVIITLVVLVPVRRAVMTEPMEAIRDE